MTTKTNYRSSNNKVKEYASSGVGYIVSMILEIKQKKRHHCTKNIFFKLEVSNQILFCCLESPHANLDKLSEKL